MSDPHVESLTYELQKTVHLEYEGPPPLDFDEPDFSGQLKDGVLTLRPKAHFSDGNAARAAADQFVKGWQIAAGLDFGRPGFQLRFRSVEVVDREPESGRPAKAITNEVSITGWFSVVVKRHVYPPPPPKFEVTPDIETLWVRYCGYIEGREPLQSMAFFCLTALEGGMGRGARPAIAQKHRISADVLNTLGELTSERGDSETGRKMQRIDRPLTGEEKVWVEAAIKAIIRQMAIQPGTELTMGTLPPLVSGQP